MPPGPYKEKKDKTKKKGGMQSNVILSRPLLKKVRREETEKRKKIPSRSNDMLQN